MFKNITAKFSSINSVQLILDEGGLKKVKTISLADFVEALNASIDKKDLKEDTVISPLYPVFEHIHTVQHIDKGNGKETIILLRNNKPSDITYFDTKFKSVGVPKLLFALELFQGIIQTVKVAAIKDSNYITKKTVLFHYPFAHVSSPTNSACLGGNRLAEKDFKINDINMSYKIPDMFLKMPNGNDYYNEVNYSNLKMRPLLESLQHKPFPNEWLKPAGLLYNEWINSLI
ncbi:prokaryotic E2 D family protein [Clostridium argentinense CDC 2741]|uniref:Prokaryotic E2 D family protein n=2 Tax=Clostridium argentinense TaxID=29341 RepID=A0A0C1R2A9_9CLOT|nr:hypothetical protein [Clostridium argentinense]ARC83132.1 hypothetical protein RSJ17_00330 [Clostridium argentinense]KIE44591.1 prokaryotic E2 D family protein [Clostridium argentinense CDC 2741]NFF41314.1 hypothetical protein [Clostridium argentinense]NFP51791.1 hypothetical protein [Clostridium argentinense]NFP74239.1 hypothetical protein [Clostridium argentinense]